MFNAASLETPVGNKDSVENLTLGDLVPDQFNMEEDTLAAIMGEWLPLLFDGRDATVLRRMCEGFTFMEIGQELGVTESRISQIVAKRIRPKVARMLQLDSYRNTQYASSGV